MLWTQVTIRNNATQQAVTGHRAVDTLDLDILEEFRNIQELGEVNDGYSIEPEDAVMTSSADWVGFAEAYCAARYNDETDDLNNAYLYGNAIAELLQHAGFDLSDLKLEKPYYGSGVEVHIGRQEWLLLDDDAATAAAIDSVKSLIDELGLESFSKSFQQTILTQFADDSQLESAINESNESYWDDLSDQDRRLQLQSWLDIDDSEFEDEDGDPKPVDLDAWRDQYLEARLNDAKNYVGRGDKPNGLYGYMVSEYGAEKWIQDMLRIDWDAVAKRVVKEDGRGVQLAGYDHEEHEFGRLFGYRTN